MTTIQVVAKRWALGLISENTRTVRAAGSTRRARREFSPTLDGLAPRIAPAVLTLPIVEPQYNGPPYPY